MFFDNLAIPADAKNVAEAYELINYLYRPEVAAKSVTLELESDPPAVDLFMNETRLAQVYYNIINNACDAMPDGGRVKLRFQESEREIITEIEDTGTASGSRAS